MREVLFRGKRTDNDEWIGGYFGIKRAFTKDGEKLIYCIMQETCDCRCEYTYFTDYEVNPETVGQFTGLTDKNGKKIFEGDILKNEAGTLCSGSYEAEVIYSNGDLIAEGFVIFEPSEFKYCEIVGNVYDRLFPRVIKQ